MRVFAAIDWGALVEVVWVSLLAGMGVTCTYSLVIYGSARSAESRRAGKGTAAAAFGALATAAFVVFAVGVVVGVAIMLRK